MQMSWRRQPVLPLLLEFKFNLSEGRDWLRVCCDQFHRWKKRRFKTADVFNTWMQMNWHQPEAGGWFHLAEEKESERERDIERRKSGHVTNLFHELTSQIKVNRTPRTGNGPLSIGEKSHPLWLPQLWIDRLINRNGVQFKWKRPIIFNYDVNATFHFF